MKDLNIVIPVKDPGGAKERLGSVLTPAQRTELALTLFEAVLTFLRARPTALHLLVVTDSDLVEAKARAFDAVVLKENRATGETDAVEKATAWSVANGFASQLVLPGDMADLDAAEFDALLQHPRPNPSVILCPATDDDGTNAILTSPPNIIPFRFGDRSFPDYQSRAKEHAVPCNVLRLGSLVLDLDTPDDLRTFLDGTNDHPAREVLRQWNIQNKL